MTNTQNNIQIYAIAVLFGMQNLNIYYYFDNKQIPYSVSTFTDSSEIFRNNEKYDIAFLDIEMKPKKYTPAHHSSNFAELVCSNSLRSDALSNAVGLLKEELRRMGSLIMEAAENSKVPAGSALAGLFQ